MRIPLIQPYVSLVKDNRNFRYLWFSQVVSLLGDWFNLIASAAVVARLSDSGLAIGGIFIARLLPPFLLGPVVGVAADRFDRRKILIFSDLLRAVVVLNFLFIRSADDIWLLYALTVLQLSISAFFEPARAAVMPGLVGRNELITANTLSGITWSAMLALGAALGGIATALFGATSAFIIDAATFLVSAWFIIQIPAEATIALDEVGPVGVTGWQTFVEGLRYLRDRPPVLVIALLKASSALAFGGVEIVQVIYAKEYFPLGNDGSGTLGIIYFTAGLGTGLGPIVARRFTDNNVVAMYWAILLSYLAMVVGYLMFGWGATLFIIIVGTLIRTVGTGINWVYASSLLQMIIPNKFLGRVFAFDLAMATLASAASTLWAGWATDHLDFSPHGVSTALAAVSLVMAAGWVVFMILDAKRQRRPLST